eukprot:a510176_81.p1 GENE.a510176_81~~a510176_81.p1  ORF type:complete len:348 (-),score=139.45 a510176_81:442-1401(-)
MGLGDVVEFVVERPKASCAVCSSFVAFVVMLALLIASFAKMPPLHVGIDYDTNQHTVDRTRVYAPGRYVLGVGHRLIMFSTATQIVDFTDDAGPRSGPPLDVFTNDGQVLTIEVSFFYRIVASEVQEIFARFGENPFYTYMLVGLAVIKNTASSFETTAFFTDRRLIGRTMLANLQETLRPMHAEVSTFSLREIRLKADFDAAFIRTVVADQRRQTAYYQQQIQLVRSDTDIINARADLAVSNTYAAFNKEGAIIVAEAAADALIVTTGAEASAVYQFMLQLAFNRTHVLQYVWTRVIRDSTDATFLVGVPASSLRINL